MSAARTLPYSHDSALSDCGAVLFDVYGTLFDVAGAARALQDQLGEKWQPLSDMWRRKQLEYTWLRSMMRRYTDFEAITADALDFALEVVQIDDPKLREDLLALYMELPVYDEVPTVLQSLSENGIRLAVLSNGSPRMLESAIESAGLAEYMEAVLSVAEVGVFKPETITYRMACDHLHLPISRMLFMSSNGWDIAGASSFGLTTIWVNRFNQPRERLPCGPARELKDLTTLPEILNLT
ncbi:MAG: haloacid dehalogenase type II [Rhodospirillaceae bacterium]